MSASPHAARAAELFVELIELAPAERLARLDLLMAGEPELGAELSALLRRFDGNPSAPNLAGALAGDVDASSGAAGQRIGPFELIAEIGRGGMGAVWRAQRVDGQYTQQVAIKRLHPGAAGAADTRLLVERFLRERQTLAGLKHPNIAALLDGGVDPLGLPWFALELVEGEPITIYAHKRQLAPRDRIRLLLQALEAVQFAHQHLVVHRDLKPDNLLVTATGDVKLLDFGIVKLLDGVGDNRTQTGARLYTPSYAAPEQVEGGEISVATDVYALGVILFELLVGRRPFGNTGGSQLPQVSAQWRAEAPSKMLAQIGPARAARGLRGDIDTLVLRCLAREPQRRYPTVQALADDLSRYLDGRPITARPDSVGYRVGKFLRRHPLGVGASVLGLGLLLGLTAFSVRQAQRAADEAVRAQEFAASAEHERDLATTESRRQELLREHYGSVLNRALASGAPVEPAALLDLLGQVDLTAAASDPSARRSIQLGLAELFLIRNDFNRAIPLLEAMAPERSSLSANEQVAYAETLAISYLRTGQPAKVDAVLSEGEAAAATLGERSAAAQAQLMIVRAQWVRGNGDVDGAFAAALRAVELARTSTTMGALFHGQILVNAAQSAMAANRFDEAEALTREGLTRWAEGGLTRNIGYRVGLTLLANLTLLRGQPRVALATFEQIASEAEVGETLPAAAARRSSHALALSLMAQHDQAIEMARAASEQFCAAVGASTPDCLRMRLTLVDVAVAAGRSELGRRELSSVQALAGEAPPATIAATLPVYAMLLDLLDNASPSSLRAAESALEGMAALGATGPRKALRLRLAAAERLLASGKDAFAASLVAAALDDAAQPVDSAMDAALLGLWRSRAPEAIAGHAAARSALTEQLGPDHPSVLRWQR